MLRTSNLEGQPLVFATFKTMIDQKTLAPVVFKQQVDGTVSRVWHPCNQATIARHNNGGVI